MTEYFRITGLNLIPFDARVTLDPDTRYALNGSPNGMDEPLTETEVRAVLPRLPEGVRSQALARGLSRITFPFTIKGASDADMEDARHDLTETLEDGKLYIETKGARGTQAVLQVKSDLAVQQSYKTIVYGEATEAGGREVLGGSIKQHFILNMQMTLYCEPHWRPETAVELGLNEIYCPSFEEDANADGEADDWDAMAGTVLAIENTIILHGCNSQKVTTDAANEGIESAVTSKVLNENSAVAYAWICRPAAGSDIRVIMRDTSNNADRATALFSTAGWPTATAKDNVNTFYQVMVSSNALPNPVANYELWIESVDATGTVFYVDKCYWLWGTTVIPDEWCDHWLVYDHYDARWLPNKFGGAGAGDEGHINYYDMDDLKGDVPARAYCEVDAANIGGAHRDICVIAQRSRNYPCQLLHVLEAEEFTGSTNWLVDGAGDATCSGGQKITNSGAAVAGDADWLIAPPVVGELGRFRLVVRAWTDDIVNTMLRVGFRTSTSDNYAYNGWRRIQTVSQWCYVDMGSIFFDMVTSPAFPIGAKQIIIEYQKDNGDTIELDFLMLLTEDETIMSMATLTDYLGSHVYDDTEDFSYRIMALLALYRLNLVCHGQLTLEPAQENRLYYVEYQHDLLWIIEHQAVTRRVIMEVKYLPQYISPLE